MTWGENEKAMIPDMAESAAEMMEAAGAKNIQPFTVLDRIPGYGIHEMGVARMGARSEDVGAEPVPADARHQQPLRDGRLGFVSGGCQNPTLTIMALAVRSSRPPDGRDEAGQPLEARARAAEWRAPAPLDTATRTC